jgi:hypothetical protein
VLSPRSTETADVLRRLRHFLRHAYPARLAPLKIERVAAAWLTAFPEVEAELQRFEQFLDGLATSMDRA